MRKNNGSPRTTQKRQQKQNKRKARKKAHDLFLYKTYRKYGRLVFKTRLAPGEKYINDIINAGKENA